MTSSLSAKISVLDDTMIGPSIEDRNFICTKKEPWKMVLRIKAILELFPLNLLQTKQKMSNSRTFDVTSFCKCFGISMTDRGPGSTSVI